MKREIMAGFLLFSVFVTAQGASAKSDIEIKIEKSPKADFSGYKTYNWIPGVEKRTTDPRLRDTELDQRVREYVDRELQARGYQKENFTDPDFWVGYYAVIESQVDKQTVRVNIGMPRHTGAIGGGSWGPAMEEVDMSRYYDQGTLILDVVDGRENKVIWRASAEAEVQEKAKIEARRERLRKAIAKMLESVPRSQAEEIREEAYRIIEHQQEIRETYQDMREAGGRRD